MTKNVQPVKLDVNEKAGRFLSQLYRNIRCAHYYRQQEALNDFVASDIVPLDDPRRPFLDFMVRNVVVERYKNGKKYYASTFCAQLIASFHDGTWPGLLGRHIDHELSCTQDEKCQRFGVYHSSNN